MIYKCTKCHHEWQTVNHDQKVCDWCGGSGKYLADDYIEKKWTCPLCGSELDTYTFEQVVKRKQEDT